VWIIEYYSLSVEQEISKLPPGLLARYLRLTELWQEFGANLGMPHTRALRNGLFELRVKGKEGIARVFYCTLIGERIVVLHSFVKKTEKIPLKELQIAQERMRKVKGT
jgi:phage-related protein